MEFPRFVRTWPLVCAMLATTGCDAGIGVATPDAPETQEAPDTSETDELPEP